MARPRTADSAIWEMLAGGRDRLWTRPAPRRTGLGGYAGGRAGIASGPLLLSSESSCEISGGGSSLPVRCLPGGHAVVAVRCDGCCTCCTVWALVRFCCCHPLIALVIFSSASSSVARCLSACACCCLLCSRLLALSARSSSCCCVPSWASALLCSFISLFNLFNEQCLTLFFFPPITCPFTLLLGHGWWGPLVGRGFGVMGSSKIGVSSPIGCGLALVRFPCTRFVVRTVVGSVGSVVEFVVAPTLGGC